MNDDTQDPFGPDKWKRDHLLLGEWKQATYPGGIESLKMTRKEALHILDIFSQWNYDSCPLKEEADKDQELKKFYDFYEERRKLIVAVTKLLRESAEIE